MSTGKVTILGINGHIGHHAAKAFVAAGWEVVGFGRSNRYPVAGVRFAKGDADSVAELSAAIGDSEVVVNAFNPPYHEWDKGRMEALHARVVEAMGTSGKTMLFPGNIYNYAQTDRVVMPETAQRPATPRGAIRVRVEEMLEAATQRGGLQVIVIRAGDFFGPDTQKCWFDQAILREAEKGKAAIIGARGVGHSWAYLPDLARAFEIVAKRRGALAPFETFHFAGHFVTPEAMTAAIVAAAPVPLKVSPFPWLILSLLGIADPVMREVAKMGYLWVKPIELRDPRLDALLGPGFSTPFGVAVQETLTRFFPTTRRVAA